MKVKRKVLICAVLLLAAFWLNLRWFYVHFTPEAAFRDYSLGRFGRMPSVVGEYDGGDVRFYFIQDGALGEKDDFAEIVWVERAGPFWRSGGSCTINNGRGSRNPIQAGLIGNEFPFVYAFKADPEVARISLRWEDAFQPPTLTLYHLFGDIHFWYLLDYTTAPIDWEDLLSHCRFTVLACDKDGRVLYLREL